MNANRSELLKCRDRILGKRNSRDNRRVWFEEQDRATDIGDNTRCYGLSNMFERIPNTSAPPAALKVVDGKLDAVQLAVKYQTFCAPVSLQIETRSSELLGK